MDKKIIDLLNQQINLEWYSAYFYLDVYAYYNDKNLDGFANWFLIQTQEERDHAMLFVTYLLNNGGRLALEDIKAAKSDFKNFAEPLHAVYEHELKITASINNIYAEAQKRKDYRTMQFLDWFVKEQGEEEKNTQDIIKKYELFGDDKHNLYMLNNELLSRTYSAPTLTL